MGGGPPRGAGGAADRTELPPELSALAAALGREDWDGAYAVYLQRKAARPAAQRASCSFFVGARARPFSVIWSRSWQSLGNFVVIIDDHQ
jgi:hypothetical protein